MRSPPIERSSQNASRRNNFPANLPCSACSCPRITRFAAASAALGMAGALYTSVCLGEDSLRAALYFIVFTALALIGPGKFSIDRVLYLRNVNRSERRTNSSED